MNKDSLARRVANVTGISIRDAKSAVEASVGIITATVASGEEVTLKGFGIFKPVKKLARKGRNPSTGAVIDIAAKTVIKFTPGKAFKEAVNK